jgi:hypothetical protein
MQWVNDKTPQLRQNMVNAGVPNFGVNYNTTFGIGFSVGENPAYYPGYENKIIDGQRNISNHLVEVRQNYGPEWHAQGQGGLDASTFFGAVGVGGDVASMSNTSFRLMSGANGSFSPKLYSSGWNGGSPARITTYSVSRIGTGVSTGAGAISTYMAYNDIIKGREQPITWVDAGVGTFGLAASYSTYFHGAEIPVVGEFVAVYGALRLSWDVGWYMGVYYGPSKWYGTDNTKWFK